MSPERLRGATARPGDDLYALGVTLWCALAGRPPYEVESLETLRAAAAAGPPRALALERPDAPHELVVAVERAMSPDASTRFADAAALACAFEAVPGAAPAAAAAVGTGTDAGAAPRRMSAPALAGTTAGLLVVIAALTAWILFGRPQARTEQAPSEPARAQSSGAPGMPAAPAAYDVAAAFLLRGPHGDTRLASGDRIRPGDRLSLEFHASQRAWVYVLNADERGECYLLFPQPLFDRGNPLPADSTVVLPGPRQGIESAWTVTSRGGREHLLVVASLAPLPELEAELALLPPPSADRPVSYARIRPATVERLRGIGGIAPAPTAPTANPATGTGTGAGPAGGPPAAFERLQALAGRETGVRGTWIRQTTLENPLHY
jgi:hypothetical protein